MATIINCFGGSVRSAMPASGERGTLRGASKPVGGHVQAPGLLSVGVALRSGIRERSALRTGGLATISAPRGPVQLNQNADTPRHYGAVGECPRSSPA